ncbi:GreA/GreB family elongation factor [Flavobacteria bacterium MS024-3C]|nr:GreA/GreB family elongation factor [Flavobacteria bacterium MS024-3C]
MGFFIQQKNMSLIKTAVYHHCESYLRQKAKGYLSQDQSLLESLDSEGKSSAGDKHETGRAMIQLEREKLAQQRERNDQDIKTLDALKNKTTTVHIAPGALVNTSLASYFLAVPADAFSHNDKKIYCISPQSPIGQLLLGKKAGESLSFRGNSIKVLEVL